MLYFLGEEGWLEVHGWMVIASTRGENVPRVLLGIVYAQSFAQTQCLAFQCTWNQ